MTAITVGFLTVRRHQEHGYFGGYLVVNALARPLEFHCTLPVRPSRAQALLYGPTLHDFICGEQIAKALINKAKLKPQLIVTDSMPTLAVSLICEIPTVRLIFPQQSDAEPPTLLTPHQSGLQASAMSVRGYEFETVDDDRQKALTVEQVLSQLSDKFDLHEPFDRIVEALYEAHPITKAA
ncbi:MAG: hypothetical protein KF752_01925 [Pirellulaceae bacterium]|nr:hypothetical protein [Pirellulaceae bacterium]